MDKVLPPAISLGEPAKPPDYSEKDYLRAIFAELVNQREKPGNTLNEETVTLPTAAGQLDIPFVNPVRHVSIINAPRQLTVYAGNGNILIGTVNAGQTLSAELPFVIEGIQIRFPTGAATDQVRVFATSGPLKVSTIDLGNTTAPATGQQTMAQSAPVVIASDQNWIGPSNLGKSEDAPSVSGDTGIPAFGVRNDTGVVTTNNDLDYTALSAHSNGSLYVSAGTTILAIDSATNFASQLKNHGNNGSGYLGAYPFLFNGTSWDRQRTPSFFKSTSFQASGDAAIWTPAAGKKFRLMKYKLDITADAATAAGANELFSWKDAAASMGLFERAWIPAASVVTGPVVAGWTTGWVDLGNGVLSAAANNALTLNTPTALTSGFVVAHVMGTEE